MLVMAGFVPAIHVFNLSLEIWSLLENETSPARRQRLERRAQAVAKRVVPANTRSTAAALPGLAKR